MSNEYKNHIKFYNRKKEFNTLNNIYKCDIVIEDRLYESGQHCLHGEKFYNLSIAYNDREAFELSKTFLKPSIYQSMQDIHYVSIYQNRSEDRDKYWDSINIPIQYEICLYKFNNYEEVRNDLINSESKLLIYSPFKPGNKHCKLSKWAGKVSNCDGKLLIIGQNILGKLWMLIRKENLKNKYIIYYHD
jgi:predicted NAD-dependent protein-ADP-ribosyltransferase YbiA (DUF1768 family)